MGNQFRPLPSNWTHSNPKAKRLELMQTLAVGGVFGLVGAGIGYALTGCDCCPGSTGVGTPLNVPITPPLPAPAPAFVPTPAAEAPPQEPLHIR